MCPKAKPAGSLQGSAGLVPHGSLCRASLGKGACKVPSATTRHQEKPLSAVIEPSDLMAAAGDALTAPRGAEATAGWLFAGKAPFAFSQTLWGTAQPTYVCPEQRFSNLQRDPAVLAIRRAAWRELRASERL